MAKIRRIIRKVAESRGDYFDEKAWPVYIALVVLGAFLMGVSAAYLRFSGVPWYANAITSLVGIPLVVVGFMIAFSCVDNRIIRRSMQLAVVVSAIVHLVMIVQMIETQLFSGLQDDTVAEREVIEPRRPRLVPQYQPEQFLPEEDRPKQDFEKPLEVQTPEPRPEPEIVVRQETPPETTQAPEQPVPLPEPVASTQPNVVKRSQTNEVAPRAGQQLSRLSRQSQPSELKISQLVQALAVDQPRPAGMEAKAAAARIERQTLDATTATPNTVDAPQSPIADTKPQLARKSDSPTPQADATPTPTLARQVNQPTRTPTSPIASAEVPPQPKSTGENALAPASTFTQRQSTASPQIARQDLPLPEMTSSPDAPRERRQAEAEAALQVAQAPVPVANRQPKATTRADVALSAQVATPAQASGAPRTAAATNVQPQATGAVTASARTELTAASTATRRQASSSPQASPVAGEPAAAQMASVAPQSTAGASPRRATGMPSDVPTPGPTGPTAPSPTRSTTAAVASVVTRAADVPANAGPQAAASAVPGPGTTAFARQAAGPSASAAQPAAASPDAGAVAMARGGMTRALPSEVPTMRPQVMAGSSPARAPAESPTAASPTAVDSPAASIAAAPSVASPQPTRVAVSRAEQGTAGVGNSANINRASPGGESPALVASAAARRAEATTQTPGDAFTPASAATIARSTAGELRPTAPLRADAADAGTAPGATAIAQVVASSSTALQQANSQATRAEVTGAKGTTDVDMGPTQVVAERGGSRTAGGGQPQPVSEVSSAQIARAETATGLPQVALAAPQADSVAAPAGESGGMPSTLTAQELGVSKSAPTSPSAATGGVQSVEPEGTTGDLTAPQLAARTEMSRSQASDGAAGGGTPGLADVEDEEEKSRRMARTAQGGAPQLAVSGPVIAAEAASPVREGDLAQATTAEPAAVYLQVSPNKGEGAASGPLLAAPSAEDPASGSDAAVAAAAIARAEAADAAPGTPLIGGGSASPAKASSASAFASLAKADMIALEGAPTSSGNPGGIPLAARGMQTERMAGGASGPATSDPQGAVAGDEMILATAGIASTPGQRQSAGGASDGPSAAAASDSALAKAGPAAGPTSSSLVAEVPEVGAGSAVAQAELDHMMGGMANTPMARQSGQALAVAAEAPEGPGGLGNEYTPEAGINSRRAREESLNVQTAATRFVRTAVGGLPAISTTAIVAREPFVNRSARLSGDQPGTGRGAVAPQTNAAIEAGLAFLARHQHADGHWSLQGFDDATNAVTEDERRFMLVSDTGATALAILAFQGWGYTHREREYRDVLERGIRHLLTYQKESGDLFVPLDDRSNQSVWLYSHALATLALCEAYGMTGDPALREPAQRAVQFIVATQNRELGGWRYSPEYDASGQIIGGIGTDTSVTGWMVAALYSAHLAGLEVPTESFVRIEKWMNSAQGAGGESHLYRYNPLAPDTAQQRHGRLPSKTMTAVGLLSRELLGWPADHPGLLRGAEFLAANPPAIGTSRQPQRDTYYWYYSTLALVYLKERNPETYGPIWKEWEGALHPLLRDSQDKLGAWAGSWNPRGPVPDRWGLHAGRLYVTTMNLLSLEAGYRYLPLHASVLGEKKK